MPPLRSVEAIDAYLAGIAVSISMATCDIDFDFTLIDVVRHETPYQTVRAGHQRSILPPLPELPSNALTRLPSLVDGFEALLSSWFTKHEQLLSVMLREPQHGSDDQASWYGAKRQMLIAVSEVNDGIVHVFGDAVELYRYNVDLAIYHQRKQAILDEDRVVIIGDEKAAMLVLSMWQ